MTHSKSPSNMSKGTIVSENNIIETFVPGLGMAKRGNYEEHQITLLKQVRKLNNATIPKCSFLKL